MRLLTNNLEFVDRDAGIDGSIVFEADSPAQAREIMEGGNEIDTVIDWLNARAYDALGEEARVTKWSFAKYGLQTILADAVECEPVDA